MKKVVLYGAGSLGKMLYSQAEREGIIDVVAFTVDGAYLTENTIWGVPVVPFEEIDKLYPADEYDMLVVCAYRSMRNRKAMYERAKAKGYKLINYISPGAYLDTVPEMGDNNIICRGAMIGHDGKMGSGNIIRQNVCLGHDFELQDHIIISIGCAIGGTSKIGSLSFFGLNATGREYLTYGEECLIGAGSVVVKNVEPYSKNYGNPARIAGYHKETGIIISGT